MKQIKQFRYYSSNDARNYPSDAISFSILVAGNLFNNHGIITHLGIQGMPGTKFYLNNSDYAIEIGATGIYELDLDNQGYIHEIRFDRASLNQYDDDDNTDRLIIDIVYEGGNNL